MTEYLNTKVATAAVEFAKLKVGVAVVLPAVNTVPIGVAGGVTTVHKWVV